MNPSFDDDPFRGTGRTTAAMLQAIAAALLNPDRWVVFNDHDRVSGHKVDFEESLREMVKRLGLTIEVRGNRHGVFLRSPIAKMRLLAILDRARLEPADNSSLTIDGKRVNIIDLQPGQRVELIEKES